MDINLDVEQAFLQNIFDYSLQKGLPLLIGMDSNSHSVFFGRETNSRGEELEELIMKNSLQVENIGTIPTYQTIRGDKMIATCIDVTLSQGMLGCVKG